MSGAAITVPTGLGEEVADTLVEPISHRTRMRGVVGIQSVGAGRDSG